MSYTRLPYGRSSYGFAEFIVDTIDDIATLPTDCKPGSTAIVTDDGVEYILNNKRQWVIKATGGSGGGTVTQAQINAAVETALANKDLVTTAELENQISNSSVVSDLSDRLDTQEKLNEQQQTTLNNLEPNSLEFDPADADKILWINSNGEIEPRTLSAASGLVVTTTTGEQVYTVESNTGRDAEDNSLLYECTAQAWQSFSIQDGETVQFTWNRQSQTVQVAADGDDFILGDPTGTNPWVRMTHRQDLGLNKLIAKVYQPTPGSIKDFTLKIKTGVPQTLDSLTLRSNGFTYRIYVDNNGSLQVQRVQ